METFDIKSDRHLRKIDRQRRLAEIEIAYKNVVAEARVKHDTLYNTVFNESTEMDEATILKMRDLAQFRVEQQHRGNFLSRLAKSVPFSSSRESMMPFAVQSSSASASFSLKSIPTSTGSSSEYNGAARNEQGTSCLTPQLSTGYHKKLILVCVAMVFVLVIGIILTMSDLNELPSTTKENMRLIEFVLVQQEVNAVPLSKRGTPQYEALLWLAKEKESGKVQYYHLENDLSVAMNDQGQSLSLNDAYREKRELLERFVLVTLYQATALTESWLKDDNWLEEGLSVCLGWFGVDCDNVSEEEPKLHVVTKLRLSKNEMKGPIPEELGHLSGLTTLYLDGNNLTGTLPDTLGNLSNLSSLRISENILSGIVPDSVCKLKDDGLLREIQSSCGGGGDEIECICCTECI